MIPQECLQYTSVFTTMRLEYLICIVVGIFIGYLYERL